MKTSYHTRQGYEQLLRNMCRECKFETPYPLDVENCSDFELLTAINYMLIYADCIPLTITELWDKKLH